jgi:MFS family permease
MTTDSSPAADPIRARQSRLSERLLIPAGFITTGGNAFQITAAAILVFRAGQTTLAVGWLFIAVAIPQVALSVLFGRLVDKLDRRTLSVASDLASAVCAMTLPVWLWLGGPATLGSYLANFLLACSAALFMPASNALVKERIADARLGKFNAHFELATNSGQLIASSLAGFLVMAIGPTPLFVFNSATFIASAALTYLIGRKPAAPAPAGDDGRAEAGATAGTRRARAAVSPPVKRLALMYINGNMGLVIANTLLTVVILHTFHKGPWLIGVVDALAFSGFIIGAACYPWVSARIKGLPLALIGMLGNVAIFCVEPLNYIVLMAVIPVAGFCFAQGRIAARTLLMRASPPDQVGRIFGGAQAFGLALSVAATVGLSVLADATAVPYAFWVLSALQGGIAIGTYLSLAKPMSGPEKPSQILEASAA